MAGGIEVRQSFESLQDWMTFLHSQPIWIDAAHIETLVSEVRANGLQTAFSGAAPPAALQIDGDNYRETICVNGLSSRARAVLDWLLLEPAAAKPACKILMHEAITPFALAVRGRFTHAIGCEYAPTAKQQAALFPIGHCDIAKAPFPDGVFDMVLSNDVLEHVTDLPAALRDTRRILKKGGAFLATFPMAWTTQDAVIKARLENGSVKHLMEPEYHGNPVDPKAGSLVFQIPGWDILDMCRESGFRSATMEFWCSQSRGFIGAYLAGILMLRAEA